MKFTFSILFLLCGLILLGIGISNANSLSSEISKFFTGSPTNRAVWMLLVGTVLAVVGSLGFLSSRSASTA